ncbi:MAG: bifunctional 4-hydroxy-2-oxoglutarate aldolase/2-dehydro-3-deoxy-phosphogluconate aldolase [Anaerolineae bacterium]|nr:bifunctional 4-hydroxy-2-oxoglutarate aldolase/2-dehydro-3-deoxy-phosphogluconate aldolase [Anaerolineae bacterium]
MKKQDVLQKVKELGLLAVLRGPSPELTIQMVDALVAGGVLGIEITYSTPDAERVVAEVDRKYGDSILLGMGTLTEPAQAQRAKAAGAKFLVSPVCESELVKAMAASGLAVMAGALTPSEVLHAYRLGSDVVKIFPGSLTGPSYVKALKGPFPDIPLMPTGGVSAANVAEWFAAGVVAVGAGSELCPPALAKEGKWDEISRKAAEFVDVVRRARG